MFIRRAISTPLRQAMRHFPVVLLTGPRQTGKTELLRQLFPKFSYHSFDALDVRQLAKTDPRAFFTKPTLHLILDEIQEAPQLLSYVKEHVDRHRKQTQIILTGSQQFALMQNVAESLAGRVGIFELLPFAWQELAATHEPKLDALLWRGMYPQIQTTPALNVDLWFSSYLSTYVERDLRAQVAIRDLSAFEALLQLLAARIGQELNMQKLATEVGVTAMTIKSWITALQAAYVIYLLPPYFRNFGKRVVKAPKIYFLDTGLVCALTKIRDAAGALSGPLAGPLFENFVISEYLKAFVFQGKKPALYFWRSHDQLEVDLIVDHGATLDAVEIKLSHTVTDQHVPNLRTFARAIGHTPHTLTVVSRSESPALGRPLRHVHWTNIATAGAKI